MKRIGKIVCLCLMLVAILSTMQASNKARIFALDDGNTNIVYSIISEEGEWLIEKSGVEIGDNFITRDKRMFEVFAINVEDRIAYARYLTTITLPKITISKEPTKVEQTHKEIGLYMTHNDESYVTGDGYDSIYGAGGIHDIAYQLQQNLINQGINAYLCNDLHIPHDTSAYSRSRVTAQKLLNTYNLNALFDIHRDGASRSTYVKSYQGTEKCSVRIVVGKANPNYAIQTKFATYLMTVAEQLYPWLFLDIYFAKGHYNQDLFSKALLFEMGSHLVEKSLVQKTVPALADVINTALFYTTVDEEDGELTVGGNLTEGNTVDEVLTQKPVAEKEKEASITAYIVVSIVAVATVILGIWIYIRIGKKHYLPKDE